MDRIAPRSSGAQPMRRGYSAGAQPARSAALWHARRARLLAYRARSTRRGCRLGRARRTRTKRACLDRVDRGRSSWPEWKWNFGTILGRFCARASPDVDHRGLPARLPIPRTTRAKTLLRHLREVRFLAGNTRECAVSSKPSDAVSMSSLAAITILAAGVLVAASVAVYLSYSVEIARSRARTENGGRTAETSVGRVEYAEKGAGVPLLSIHGAGGGYDQGLDNAVDLVGENFRIIAPSRFGYLGAGIPSDTSSATQADAFAALLNTLRIRRAVVVGVSAGARSAVEFALRHPDSVSALILIVPGTYAPTSPVSI